MFLPSPHWKGKKQTRNFMSIKITVVRSSSSSCCCSVISIDRRTDGQGTMDRFRFLNLRQRERETDLVHCGTHEIMDECSPSE
jgi:hypothetical protein